MGRRWQWRWRHPGAVTPPSNNAEWREDVWKPEPPELTKKILHNLIPQEVPKQNEPQTPPNTKITPTPPIVHA